ncbi:hypothetical protein X801_04066 [Opisthorchis viverrini]|uniref:Uncharacterized protein n=1 Tax=Opisthorchis viverrini TaxID=6198 RepID=A0A1S8X084_OPIVI|nr:hypothetical protein X801_04066 [Opisthorchis viverrini]
MDFSGRFPVSYLKEEQRSEFESKSTGLTCYSELYPTPRRRKYHLHEVSYIRLTTEALLFWYFFPELLTAGRLARIRDALHILRPKTGPTVECRGDYTSFLHPNSDINLFKSPMVPKHGGKPLCPDSLSKHYGSLSHRSSTLRSATNPVGRVGRQGSVLLNMLHSAANAVHCDPYSEQRAHGTLYARTVSAGTNDESGASKPSGAGDACSLDSSASSDLGCLQSSLVNRVVLEPNDTALATIPYHKLPKHPPRSADPETLAILLSLLPSSPSDQSPGKKKKANGHNYRKVFRHPRSPSSHSLALDSVDKLPRKSSFSHSAELAETDIRSLFGRRMHGVLQRKKSTNSLHSANSSLDPEISDSHVNCSLRTQFRCRSVDCGILSKP